MRGVFGSGSLSDLSVYPIGLFARKSLSFRYFYCTGQQDGGICSVRIGGPCGHKTYLQISTSLTNTVL